MSIYLYIKISHIAQSYLTGILGVVNKKLFSFYEISVSLFVRLG